MIDKLTIYVFGTNYYGLPKDSSKDNEVSLGLRYVTLCLM